METYMINSNEKMSFIYRFFCWCSGARLYILKQCPTDYNKYFGIGIVVFLTGVMASISGGYAIFTIFNSISIAFVFGLFWGTVIFFLDWYLISSIKKEDKFHKEILFALPRLILAVFLAVIISKPLELKLFEAEINQILYEIQQNENQKIVQNLEGEFSNIERLNKQNEKLKQELKQKESERNSLFQLMIAEAEGNGGTGQAGKGSVYNEKKLQYEKIETELNDLKKINLAEIRNNNKKIDHLETLKTEQLKEGKQITKNYAGFLARLEALGKLSEKNETIKYSVWFIIFLFITIESAPVLVKLMSAKGSYEQLLEVEEYAISIKADMKRFEYQINATNFKDMAVDKNELKSDADLKNNQEYIYQISQAQSEVNKRKVEKWKESELNDIEKNVEQHIDSVQNIINKKIREN